MVARPVALITGARRGIGRACGLSLAQAGFDIAATDLVLDAETEMAQAEFAAAGAQAAFFAHDVAKLADQDAFLGEVAARFGHVSCLVNNAGRGAVQRGDLMGLTAENFDVVMNVNLRGTLFFTQAVANAMLAKGETGHARSIITITSVSAEMVTSERADYCISKAGLSMAVKAFAERLAPDNISVFEVRPGIIRTDMTAPVAGRYDEAIQNGLVPARRWGQPQDVAQIVAGLAGGAFGFATGSVIGADGGLGMPRL